MDAVALSIGTLNSALPAISWLTQRHFRELFER